MGASSRGRGCVAPRVPEPSTRSLGRVGRNARGAGGLGWRPSRKGSGRGQVHLRRRSDSGQPFKVGEGVPWRAPAASEINKAAHGRAGGHPHPASAGTAAASPRPDPPLPQRSGLPGPRAPTRPPRACGAWEVLRPPPAPGCSAARSPHSSPRLATSSSAGRAAPAWTARLGSGLQLPSPLHTPRRGPRPGSAPAALSPAQAPFAPTWPACPPSPGHCAHVRGRGHNPARIPARGRERKSAPASE